jgi:hypothetical protein
LNATQRLNTLVEETAPMVPILRLKNPVLMLIWYLFKITFNIVLLPTLRSSERSFPFRISDHSSTCSSHLSYSRNMFRPFHPVLFDHFDNIWWNEQIMKFLITQFSLGSYRFFPLRCRYSTSPWWFLSTIFWSTPSPSVFFIWSERE